LKTILLLPLTAIYCLFYFLWDLYWSVSWQEKASCRVISVGNITVGGSGKTSLVEYIASRMLKNGIKTAVVAKGYKRPGSSSLEICDSDNLDWRKCGDEATALAKSLEGLKIYVDFSKTYAALKASESGYDVIVVDDGFQHRRLIRDLDIVCIDSQNPYGNGWLLPYGILREPLKSLKRADAFVVFTENDNIDLSELKLPAGKPVFKARKIIQGVMTAKNGFVDLAGKKVLGFCAIANPDSFGNTLDKTGADIVAFEKFRDHYIYDQEDIDRLVGLMETSGAENAVTTLKDFVKLEETWPDAKNLCYIKINLAIDNEEEFIRLIENE
jgi:tetraacyldisaccharide 4'-kinase